MGNRRFFASAAMPDQFPAVGQQCPVFDVKDVHGKPVMVGRTLVAGRSTLLMFLNTDSPAGARLLPVIQGVAACEGVDVVVISSRPHTDVCHATAADDAGILWGSHQTGMRHVVSAAISQRFGAGSQPCGVLLDAQGVIVARGHCTARRHIDKLFGAQRRGYYSLYGYLSRISRYARPVYGLR